MFVNLRILKRWTHKGLREVRNVKHGCQSSFKKEKFSKINKNEEKIGEKMRKVTRKMKINNGDLDTKVCDKWGK